MSLRIMRYHLGGKNMPEAEEDVKKAHIMQIRVEWSLWKRFKSCCNRNDATPSEVVREFMRAMVREERGLS